MISFRSFELLIHQDKKVVAGLEFRIGAMSDRRIIERPVQTDRRVVMSLGGPPIDQDLRVRIGGELAAVLRAGQEETRADLTDLLHDQCGEAVIRIEIGPDEENGWAGVVETRIPLAAPVEVVRLYETLIRELEEAHVGLARDLLGNLSPRTNPEATRLFEPAEECGRLERNLGELRVAMSRIGRHPASALTRERELVRWRPGDVVDSRTLGDVARSSEQTWENGRLTDLGRLRASRARATTDLPEHRHLKSELFQLARRAARLRSGCSRAADLMISEQLEWDLATTGRASVYEQRFEPRVQKLEELARNGDRLADGFRELVMLHEFIAEAGKPRTRFGPTPLFLGRPGYREAFQTLSRARSECSPSMDGQSLRIRCRNLDLLYEYWTYVCVVEACRRLLGPPAEGDGFEVVDEVYRPELTPGQHFGWHLRDGRRVRVWYEPAIPPLGSSRAPFLGWRASLVGAPLRPDVLVVVEGEQAGVRAMVVDAKNCTRFGRERLFQVSDYRTLVHEEETGRQPIRQVFLAHRDPRVSSCTLPGYLEEEVDPPAETSVLGAVPLLPETREELRSLVARFLAAG